MNCGIRSSVDPVLSGQLGLVDSVRGEYWRRDWDLRDSRGGSMSSVDVRNEFFQQISFISFINMDVRIEDECLIWADAMEVMLSVWQMMQGYCGMQFYYDYVFVGDLEMCLGLQFGGRREEKWRWEAADGGEGCRENADVGNENFNR